MRTQSTFISFIFILTFSFAFTQSYSQKTEHFNIKKIDPSLWKFAQEMLHSGENIHLQFPNPHPDAQWFPKAGFGLFMHWGIHSVVGAQPSWAMIKDYKYGGPVRLHPPERYYALADQFNPSDYNPDKWIKAAAEAGMQYAVLTTKHHDGYALWPSKYGNMSTKNYMEGRDLIKPYVEACRKYGIKIGFYFSPRDWNFPGYPLRDVNFDTNQRDQFLPIQNEKLNQENWENFFAFTIGQLKELLSNYGKIDVLWFDGVAWNGVDDMRTAQVYQWIRELQPGIVINNRWGNIINPDDSQQLAKEKAGDFTTPEAHVPDGRPDGWWESCIAIDGHWGYNGTRPAKSASKIIQTLVNCRKWGGNYLMNCGPAPDGTMPNRFYYRCEELTEWMEYAGESVIGAGPTPGENFANVPITTGENCWYLHVVDDWLDWQAPVKMSNIEKAPRWIIHLRTGNKIEFSYENKEVTIPQWPGKTGVLDDVLKVVW